MYTDCPNRIQKTRYYISAPNNLLWEIDFFRYDLSGLVVAEIELLPSITTEFEKTLLIGEEVTHDFRYLNSVMSVKGMPN